MVHSWERTLFRSLRWTNTLKDKSECLMSSNGELDGSNGTQHNNQGSKKLNYFGRVHFCIGFPDCIYRLIFSVKRSD